MTRYFVMHYGASVGNAYRLSTVSEKDPNRPYAKGENVTMGSRADPAPTLMDYISIGGAISVRYYII